MRTKPRDGSWWWTKVFVPIVGSGGVVTLLIAGLKACNPEKSGSGNQTFSGSSSNGSVYQGGRDIVVHEPPKPRSLDPATESSLRQELEAVKKDISVWENAKIKDEAERMKIKNDLFIATQEGRTFIADACRQNLELHENLMATKKAELENSLRRRTEIEQLLNR